MKSFWRRCNRVVFDGKKAMLPYSKSGRTYVLYSRRRALLPTPFLARSLKRFSLDEAFFTNSLKCLSKLSFSSNSTPKYLGEVDGLTMSLKSCRLRSCEVFSCRRCMKISRNFLAEWTVILALGLLPPFFLASFQHQEIQRFWFRRRGWKPLFIRVSHTTVSK